MLWEGLMYLSANVQDVLDGDVGTAPYRVTFSELAYEQYQQLDPEVAGEVGLELLEEARWLPVLPAMLEQALAGGTYFRAWEVAGVKIAVEGDPGNCTLRVRQLSSGGTIH
jgi:hypothetical protein